MAPAELKKALALYQSIEKLQARFHQTKTLKDLNVRLQSEGELTLAKPDTVIWDVRKPSPMKMELTAGEARLTTATGTQTLKADAGPQAENMKNLSAWLKLDADALAKNYSVEAAGKNAFRFKARDQKQSPFLGLDLTLAPDGHVQRLVLAERSGDEIDIKFDPPHVLKKKK